MIAAPDGGILDDLIVYRLGEARFLVVANASNALVVSDALAERLAGFKVLDDRSLATALIAIQGPRSVDVLAPHTDVDLGALRYYGIAEGHVAGMEALVARTGYTGEDGFEVFVDWDRATELWDVLMPAVERRAGCRWGSAPATRSASRPACRCTATSSTRRRTLRGGSRSRREADQAG